MECSTMLMECDGIQPLYPAAAGEGGCCLLTWLTWIHSRLLLLTIWHPSNISLNYAALMSSHFHTRFEADERGLMLPPCVISGVQLQYRVQLWKNNNFCNSIYISSDSVGSSTRLWNHHRILQHGCQSRGEGMSLNVTLSNSTLSWRISRSGRACVRHASADTRPLAWLWI